MAFVLISFALLRSRLAFAAASALSRSSYPKVSCEGSQQIQSQTCLFLYLLIFIYDFGHFYGLSEFFCRLRPHIQPKLKETGKRSTN